MWPRKLTLSYKTVKGLEKIHTQKLIHQHHRRKLAKNGINQSLNAAAGSTYNKVIEEQWSTYKTTLVIAAQKQHTKWNDDLAKWWPSFVSFFDNKVAWIFVFPRHLRIKEYVAITYQSKKWLKLVFSFVSLSTYANNLFQQVSKWFQHRGRTKSKTTNDDDEKKKKRHGHIKHN